MLPCLQVSGAVTHVNWRRVFASAVANELNGSVVLCMLICNSTKLESRVDFGSATIVGPIQTFNHGNKCCLMCALTQSHKRGTRNKNLAMCD